MPFSLDKQLLIAAASFGKRTQALLWATINERLSLRPGLVGPTDKCMGKKHPWLQSKTFGDHIFDLINYPKISGDKMMWIYWMTLFFCQVFFITAKGIPTLPGLCRVRVNRFCSKRPLSDRHDVKERSLFPRQTLRRRVRSMDSLVVSEGFGVTSSAPS